MVRVPAGAYKGLTIRIGADLTKLSTGLRTANSAIFKTGSELRKLSQATRIDPGNINVATRQIGALGAQAVNIAAKMSSLNQGIKQLSEWPVSQAAKDVADLARNTDSVTLAAERAKMKYAEVNRELEWMSKAIKEATDYDVSEETRAGTFDEKRLRSLVGDEQADVVMELKDRWEEARAALDDYTNAAKFGELNAELAAQEAEINKINRQLAEVDRYKSFSELGNQLEPVNQRLTLVSAAAKTAQEYFSRLDTAFTIDPSNLDLAAQHTKALGEAMVTAQMQSNLLKERIASYESAGLDRTAQEVGSISVEVEQSEAAFHKAQRALDEYTRTGSETDGMFKILKADLEAAQQRMDTAHAVQQYSSLKAQVAEVDAGFVKMAKSLADIKMPSSVESSLANLRTQYEAISESLRSTEGSADSLKGALELNPDNVRIAATQMELLEEAERLATEEAQGLKEQLAAYDIDAIREASDYTKSAAQQTNEAAAAYDEAAARVRELNIEIANTQGKRDNEAFSANIDAYDRALANLREQLRGAKADEEAAFQQFDLSRQRQEVSDLDVKVAQNEATMDRLYVAMQKASGQKIVPEVDFSALDKLKERFDSLSDGSTALRSFGDVNEKIKGLGSAFDDAKRRADELSSALQENPGNTELTEQQMHATAEAISLAEAKLRELNAAKAELERAGVSNLDITTGNVAVKAEEAASRYRVLSDVVDKLQARATSAQEELGGMSEAAGRTEEGAQRINELNAEIEECNRLLEDAKGEMEAAFKNADFMQRAKDMGNLDEQITRTKLDLAELRETAAGASRSFDGMSTVAHYLKPIDAVLDQVSAGAEQARGRFDALNKASQIRPLSISTTVRSMVALREAINATREKADTLRSKLEAYKADGIDRIARNTGNAAVAFQKANANVEQARAALKNFEQSGVQNEEELARLKKALQDALKEADTAAAVNEFKELEVEIRTTDTQIDELKKSMNVNFGEVGTAAVNAGVQIGQFASRAGRSIITSSSEIDASYRDLRKTFEAEEGEYKQLYDAAMKYSMSHVTSASDMLEMEAIAAQLGVGMDESGKKAEDAAERIGKFAEVAANLDVATDIQSDTIALQMGQIMNVMGDLDTDNIDKFGDALVRLGNNMPTQESNIMQITQRLSAIGDVAHFSTPDLMGWAAAIASTGQKSEAAASGIATTITNISKAVSAGGDSLEKYAEVAGMSAEKFAEEWRSKPSDTLKAFVRGLKDDGDEVFATLMGLDINGVRQNQTLAALAQTVDTVDNSVRMATDAFNGLDDEFGDAGDAAREAERKAEGFSGTYEKLKNTVGVLAAEFGDAMVPYMKTATQALERFISFFDKLDDKAKGSIVLFGGLAAGFAAVEPVAAAMFSNLGKIFGGLSKLIVNTVSQGIVWFKSFGGGVTELSTKGSMLTNVGTAVTKLASSLSAAATSGSLFLGIFGGIAAATVGAFLVEIVKSNAEAAKFNGVMEDMKGSADGLAAEMLYGKDAVAQYGTSWKDAKVNMNDFLSGLQDHYRKIGEVRESTGESIGMLEKYKEIIDKAAGAGKDYAGSQGELKWAIDGLNEALGTSYTKHDILFGAYDKESGSVRNLRGEIDQLIESKKRELQVSAYEEMYTEASKAQAETEIAYKKARKARRDFVKEYAKEHTGDTSVDRYGNLYTMTEEDAKNAARMTGTYRELNQAVGETREAYQAAGEELKVYDDALTGAINKNAFYTSNAYGEREGIMMTTQAMSDAIIANGQWGSSLEEIQPKVKTLAQGLQDAGVGAKEFAELSNQNPDVFGKMVEQADGDMDTLIGLIDEWNDKQLEEKYGEIKWNEDHTSFETLEGEIYEWTGNDYTLKFNAEVEGEENIDQAKANAEEGADMPVNAKVEDSSVDESKANAEEGADMPVNAEVDDSGIDEAKDEAEDGTSMNVNVTLDTSELAANLSGAVNGADTGGINIPVRLDTSTFASQIEELGTDKQINVGVTADTGAIQAVTDTLGKVPTDVRSTITVSSNGLQKATERIADLNEVANKMSSKSRSYKATGNAAGSDKAAKNVASLNTAANNMRNKSVYISANGNVASGAAASNTWNLVHAINSLQSKAVTLTTTRVTRDVKKATGTYINPNKMPKHAAGIFTRPTLTNIGWVGEDGAELYSGNSLVPLTNRKYSMPYIDDISDAVARKLGGNQPQNNITVTVTGVSGPDEVANAIARTLGILNL